ncbi:hypothetical protein WG68_03265 [Arsukibacterium ikkense]|uniref:CARDB domain-containing protein n=1 Tax=Arsukibacterium ikkense TaxID=336831 RepID=A0A0M2V8N1_9GAMM|nr:hypothetical protein [Arsukibacterium ikkense]KKO46966.1 hypothetical protein WG68_03265 [Arsukibacterium ikkense]
MKKVFNASLVAASMALAFGASAADLTISAPTVITTEAAAAGVAAPGQAQTIRVLNRAELVPGDKITLTFPIGTVLADPTLAADFSIDYGNGTFTFTNITWTPSTATVAPKLEMEVQLGNPVIANSAFDVIFAGTNFVPRAGNVTYKAVDGVSGVAKDTTGNNSAALTTSVAQRTVSAVTAFDGFVNRLDRDEYNDKGSVFAEVNVKLATAGVQAVVASETLVLNGTFNANTVANIAICADGTKPTATFGANLGALACGAPPALVSVAGTLSCSAVAPAACGANDVRDTLTFNTATIAAAIAAGNGTFVVNFGTTAGNDIALTEITATHPVVYTGVAPVTNQTFKYLDAASVGKTRLDASVVNVPYLPVGYPQFSTTVEVSNLGATDAEIILEAVGKTGVKYGPVTLAKKAVKNGVTTVFESDMMTAFGLAKGDNEKLSVTFVIDANAADITLAPYYREGTSRINVISDQYKK